MIIEECIYRILTYYYRIVKKITIGHKSRILGPVEFDTSSGGRINIGDKTRICKWCIFKTWGGNISIGDCCSINSFTHISGQGDVSIGSNVLIATQVVIVSANHVFSDINMPIRLQGDDRKKITIGDDVWIGAGAKILAGVTIGKGAVIGANAVVNRDIPSYCVAVGVPAKVIKQR